MTLLYYDMFKGYLELQKVTMNNLNVYVVFCILTRIPQNKSVHTSNVIMTYIRKDNTQRLKGSNGRFSNRL